MNKTKKTRASGSIRVLRGGSWHFVPQYARVANRSSGVPGLRYISLGVRLVEVLDEQD